MKDILSVLSILNRSLRPTHGCNIHHIITGLGFLRIIHIAGCLPIHKCAGGCRRRTGSHGNRGQNVFTGRKYVHVSSSVIGEVGNMSESITCSDHNRLWNTLTERCTTVGIVQILTRISRSKAAYDPVLPCLCNKEDFCLRTCTSPVRIVGGTDIDACLLCRDHIIIGPNDSI